MGFRIDSSVNTASSYLHSNLSSSGINKSLGNLATVSASNSLSYNNASGLKIADGLSVQVSSLGQSILNANDSIGMVQVADNALKEYENILQDVRVLSLKASSDTLSSSDRNSIQEDIDTFIESTNTIATTTTYGGNNLLDGKGGDLGNGTFITHSGVNEGEIQSLTIKDTQTSAIISKPIDVSSPQSASKSLSTIDSAMRSIKSIRSDLDSAQDQLISTIRNTSVTRVNIASAESQIRDIDFAAESANFSKQNILSRTGSFAQSQVNTVQSSVLNIIK